MFCIKSFIGTREIYPELKDMITGAMSVLDVGPTDNFNNDIGPIISKDAFNDLNDYIETAKENSLEVYQSSSNAEGNYIPATLIDINSLDEIKSEKFGPILHIMKFKSAEIKNVIHNINKLNYGLTLGIHTRVESRADEISKTANIGNVYINRDMVGAVVGVQPFGGEGFLELDVKQEAQTTYLNLLMNR